MAKCLQMVLEKVLYIFQLRRSLLLFSCSSDTWKLISLHFRERSFTNGSARQRVPVRTSSLAESGLKTQSVPLVEVTYHSRSDYEFLPP